MQTPLSLKPTRRADLDQRVLPLVLLALATCAVTESCSSGEIVSGAGGRGGTTEQSGGANGAGASFGGTGTGGIGATGAATGSGGAGAGGSTNSPADAGFDAASFAGAGGDAGGSALDAGAGGAPPDAALPDVPAAPRPCRGRAITGSGPDPQLLRTDMAIRRLMVPPPSSVRLVRNPRDQKLYLMVESGAIYRVDIDAAQGTAVAVLIISPADIGMPQGAQAFGMTFGPDGSLYVVSHMPMGLPGWATTSRATIWRGRPSGGGFTFRKLAETVPYGRSNTYFDHEWSGIVASPDGRHVYVNCGSRTDHGEVQSAGGAWPGARETALTARILRFPADAENLLVQDDEGFLMTHGYLFARGLRNSFDPEFSPDGVLWAGDNGPDGDYHEELNRIEAGHHYGFPWRLGNEDNLMRFPDYNPATDKRLDPAYGATRNGLWHNDPGFPAPPQGVTFTDPIINLGPHANQYRDPVDGRVKQATATAPIGTFSDHGSPLGLTFDDGGGALCGEFSGAMFILRYGKAAGDFEDGKDLLHVRLEGDSRTATRATVTQIVRNFRRPMDAVLVGATLYILDRGDNGGAGLFELTLPR